MDECSSTGVRLNRIELDIAELKVNDKEHALNMLLIEKSNIRTEGNVAKILDSLTDLKSTTKDITADITMIKEKPAKEYEVIKGIIIVIAVSNVVGIVWSMLIK